MSCVNKAAYLFTSSFGQASINSPYGVCLDGGNVYICDNNNNRVQVLTKEGVLVR